LERKRYLRLLEIPNYPGHETSAEPLEFRQVTGGLLIQTPDNVQENDSTWTVMTKRAPTEREWDDLRFAWRVVRLVRSNAIVIARDAAVLGIGGGQPNRLDSVGLAVNRAGARAHGAVLASDAFFPFADGVEVATDAGISAIVQPGGSLRDAEVVAAADDAGIAMLATGIRHFRH
jgi:phosphoribosylaminoimidazolecarboxamide formyltransferase/IMP cyclohydrolase